MYYLIYLSSAASLFNENQLKEILEVSRSKNSEKGITGILLYSEGSIIQLLEGEEEKVKQLFKKIAEDPRHAGVIKLAEGPLNKRNFPDWSMGFKTVSPEETEKLTGFKNVTNPGFPNADNDNTNHPAMTVLRSFLKYNRI